MNRNPDGSRFVVEVAIDGLDDWQPFEWVGQEESGGYSLSTPLCSRCGLPVYSLLSPEPGYWHWKGTGLAPSAPNTGGRLAPVVYLCARHVGVPELAEAIGPDARTA